jgi:hypothetical protein
MSVTQTRSQKSKVLQKMPARAVTVAAKPKRENSVARPGPVLSVQERQRLVEQAAYFRAEKRGFAPGCELQDWVEAEAVVLRLIGRV